MYWIVPRHEISCVRMVVCFCSFAVARAARCVFTHRLADCTPFRRTMPEQTRPPQKQQRQPGVESQMHPKPASEDTRQRGSGKLEGKRALITGGDSGIGRAVAVAFAKEGADVVISYLNEHGDADETRRLVQEKGRKCIAISGDIGDEGFCRELVDRTLREIGRAHV